MSMELDTLKAKLLELDSRKDFEKYAEMRKYLSENGVDVVPNGGAHIGRCYEAMYYEIRCSEELPKDFISFLRKVGLLGYGQEFWTQKAPMRDGKFIIQAEARVDSSD
jgi:hypothetical protein